MSIFIAVPSMIDPELESTITSAIQNADNPEDVHIGLAVIGTKKLYKELSNKFNKFKNVKLTHRDHSKGFGVGLGRQAANSLYGGQDYYLQCDSHTLFSKGWDTSLISILNEATLVTENKKTILTGYLNGYTVHPNNERKILGSQLRYSAFGKGPMKGTNAIPFFNDLVLDKEEYSERFYPSVKFCANFAFSKSWFGLNTGLHETAVFFDEEPIQTINLLNDGVSLVFPMQDIPLNHLYKDQLVDGIGDRVSLGAYPGEAKPKEGSIWTAMDASYIRYTTDPKNAEKVKKFQAYTKVHPKLGCLKPGYVPKEFNR